MCDVSIRCFLWFLLFAPQRIMKSLLAIMALACVLNVVLNARIFGEKADGEIDLRGEINDSEEDEKLAEDKELDKALQEILYQDEDQDLSV